MSRCHRLFQNKHNLLQLNVWVEQMFVFLDLRVATITKVIYNDESRIFHIIFVSPYIERRT